MDIRLALEEYGLTNKEIDVYVALLPLGNINLQELAKRIDLPRSTIYNTLNYLANKGLVSKIIVEKTSFFQAAEPKKILEKLKEKEELIKKALPELENLKKLIKNSSNAEIYQGQKGLSTILADIFKIKQQLYYFGSYSLSVETLKHQPDHFRTVRLERKIPAQIVIDPCNEEIFHKREYKAITKMRFLSSLKDFPCVIFIYGDKVAIYTVKGDLIGIIIKNEQIAQAMKMIFDVYWAQAKPARL